MVSTPCIRICQIEPESQLCLGCWRSLDEIAAWGGMSEPQRLAVMALLPDREARFKAGRTSPRQA